MKKELAKAIGNAARQARKELDFTQEDAAERIGVSVEFYARIERGNSLPSVPTLARIASTLGVSADVLLGRKDFRGIDGVPNWQPDPTMMEKPEIRRLLRLLRRASPATLRLTSMLIKEIERTHTPGSKDPADDNGNGTPSGSKQ